ncbi:MAG: hypothetical protein HW389_2785, partial [Bacteroidetes bacterium]|nr:hypothetical protein [Bacteroidota bacterium]
MKTNVTLIQVPIPIIHIVFFNAEALRTQRIAEKKAIDSAVLRDLRVSALRTIKTKTQCLFLGMALEVISKILFLSPMSFPHVLSGN